jgi:hypothetical protein
MDICKDREIVYPHHYWFGYFLSTVRGLAADGNERAENSFRDFCERGMPNEKDLELLAIINNRKEK